MYGDRECDGGTADSPRAAALPGSRISGLGLARHLLVLLLVAALPLSAQDNPELERSRERLQQIRREREQLVEQQRRLQGQVTDVNAQLRNLQRQRDNTNELVTEIERQIRGLGSELEGSASEVALAEDNLVERKAVLRRRLADIYKRGPLYTFQVLLTAESFGDLLTRYKYLYLTSRQDRTLVTEVERLTDRVRSQRNQLLGIQNELDRRREERESELQRYGSLMQEQQSTLRTLQRSSQQTSSKLTALERDEARLNDILASLDRARRTSGNAAAGGARGISTADIGKLDWPVEGRILYQFGTEQLANGGTIRHNGIAIGAPAGSAVHAVDAGKVRLKERLGTYGLTLIVEHTSGLFAVYSQLSTTEVDKGDTITKGQVIGTVGGLGSDQGPHLYFEIRGDNQITLDPLVWLQRRSN